VGYKLLTGMPSLSRLTIISKCRTGHTVSPNGWRPDINDGVKINIAPWERLGLFPVKEIVGEIEMGE
jgi:hypothetical protein